MTLQEDTFDYAHWACRLRDKLIERGSAYHSFDKMDRDTALAFEDGLPGSAADAARLEAVKAFSELMQALIELPVFKQDITGAGLKPLADLATAIAGLHHGHHSALLETRKIDRASRPPEHVGDFRKGQRQAMACYIVELFERSGSQTAGKDAAALLARYGMTGRKKVDGILPPISHKVLEKWAAEIDGEDMESHRRQFLENLRRTAGLIDGAQAKALAGFLAPGIMNI